MTSAGTRAHTLVAIPAALAIVGLEHVRSCELSLLVENRRCLHFGVLMSQSIIHIILISLRIHPNASLI
jgi:hypothetical protein